MEITLKDTVLGSQVNHYASAQEFECVVDGRRVVVVDNYKHETGDKVQLIYRDGEYYSIRSEEFPDSGVTLMERLRFKYIDNTKGNDFFILIVYILLTILTFRTRIDFRKKYFKLAIVTHVFGGITAVLFVLTCFWLDVITLIFYAVIFSIFWIVWITVKNVKTHKNN
ncbi:MAG: hypothetical protein K6E10_11260 [Eubacterium sp.]|nr:hypothetical protein [Eubacterium sp.]